MPKHGLHQSWPPSSSSSSYSSYLSLSSYQRQSKHNCLLQVATEYPYADRVSTRKTPSVTRHHYRKHHRLPCFRLRFLSSHGAVFRLLGAALCACSLLHFIVHLFVSDLFDLISGTVPVEVGPIQEQFRNLTWHVGPQLDETDRRVIIVYTYPYLDTNNIDTTLRDHPRVLWLPEHLIMKYTSGSGRQRRVTQNLTTMMGHLFNCSNVVVPLMLHIVNEEAVARGQDRWCFARASAKSGAKCKQSCIKESAGNIKRMNGCRKVTRRQLRTFCQQHHLAVQLVDTWKLRESSELLSMMSNLKVVHVIGFPIIHHNTTHHIHFSSRTHKLSRLYHNDVLKPRQHHICERIKDDINWLSQVDGHSNSLDFYQQFPISCFESGDIESSILELYNFLDIYMTDNIRLATHHVNTSSDALGCDAFPGAVSLTEQMTRIKLEQIHTKLCSTSRTLV